MLQDLRLNPGESTASAFARIDTNGDELVSREELRAAGVPEARANAMLERGDVTGDGLLDLQEMRRLALLDDEFAPRVAARGGLVCVIGVGPPTSPMSSHRCAYAFAVVRFWCGSVR